MCAKQRKATVAEVKVAKLLACHLPPGGVKREIYIYPTIYTFIYIICFALLPQKVIEVKSKPTETCETISGHRRRFRHEHGPCCPLTRPASMRDILSSDLDTIQWQWVSFAEVLSFQTASGSTLAEELLRSSLEERPF